MINWLFSCLLLCFSLPLSDLFISYRPVAFFRLFFFFFPTVHWSTVWILALLLVSRYLVFPSFFFPLCLTPISCLLAIPYWDSLFFFPLLFSHSAGVCIGYQHILLISFIHSYLPFSRTSFSSYPLINRPGEALLYPVSSLLLFPLSKPAFYLFPWETCSCASDICDWKRLARLDRFDVWCLHIYVLSCGAYMLYIAFTLDLSCSRA